MIIVGKLRKMPYMGNLWPAARSSSCLFLLHPKRGFQFLQIVARVQSFSSDVFSGMDGILSTKTIKRIVQFAARVEMFARTGHEREPMSSG